MVGPDSAALTPPMPSIFAPPLAPIGRYFSAEDLLRLTVYNGGAGVTVELRGRALMLGERTARDVVRSLTPATDRSASTVSIVPGEGWLLDAEIVVTAGTPVHGQTYARLSIIRGQASVGYEIAELAAGYVTLSRRLAVPTTRLDGSIEGPGAIRSVAGTDPAAGVEISETVPTGARWRLRSLDAALVTDGTAANREPTLTIDDGANIVAEISAGATQAATLTRRYSFTQGVQHKAGAASTIVMAPAADLILLAGWRIRTVTTAIVAGDNWGAPRLCVEEWMEP